MQHWHFITNVKGSEPHSFKEFQDLPRLVQWALAWATLQQDAGEVICDRDVTRFIIEHYDARSEALPVGQLIRDMDQFILSNVRCRMVRCYVDHGCNMLAAKLAWHEGY